MLLYCLIYMYIKTLLFEIDDVLSYKLYALAWVTYLVNLCENTSRKYQILLSYLTNSKLV